MLFKIGREGHKQLVIDVDDPKHPERIINIETGDEYSVSYSRYFSRMGLNNQEIQGHFIAYLHFVNNFEFYVQKSNEEGILFGAKFKNIIFPRRKSNSIFFVELRIKK